jgi:two-component system cell cycle sensor histidine kinase/response regulator CckA
LLVEDSEDDASLLLRALKKAGYALDALRIESAPAMEAALDEGTWDIVISDHSMPGFSSLDALKVVRARDAHIPFLVVSGTIGEETAVQAMKAGAHDYVMKGNLARLVPAIERELRDSGDRRQAAEALRRSEDQLRQAQKMEAIGRLAGGIAHDFNNLLTAIIGYSELLLTELEQDNPHRRDIQEIKVAGDRAAALTRQLLLFSRQQVLEPRVLDLNSVISEMDQLFRRLIGEDIELTIACESWLDPVKADPGQLGQVVMNLVVNARDAMPGGGRLTIETAHAELDEEFRRTHQGAPVGAFVVLAVSDSGCGMDAETQARLFEPFFTTKPTGQGTGLGLSTVYGIVQQSNGYISVYSEPGRGSTFRIYLPRVQEPVTHVPSAAVHPRTVPGSETILVADDEAAVRELVVKVLTSAGYRVLQAGDGRAALDLAREHAEAIDLLITDVVMPDIHGPDLATGIARVHPETRVLYLSGYTDRAIVNNGVLHAGLAFLQKPFTPALLSAKVREVLDAPDTGA